MGLNHFSAESRRRNQAAGSQLYAGYWHGAVVVTAWLVAAAAVIGQMELAFTPANGDRCLWDCAATATGLRPQVIACFLRAILAQEWPEGERFWLAQPPASAVWEAGAALAGFTQAGEMVVMPDGRTALRPASAIDRARAGAAVLGLVLSTG